MFANSRRRAIIYIYVYVLLLPNRWIGMMQTDRPRQTIEFDCTRFSAVLVPVNSNSHYIACIQLDFKVWPTPIAIFYWKIFQKILSFFIIKRSPSCQESRAWSKKLLHIPLYPKCHITPGAIIYIGSNHFAPNLCHFFSTLYNFSENLQCGFSSTSYRFAPILCHFAPTLGCLPFL